MESEKELFEHDFSGKILSKEAAHEVSKIQREFLESYINLKDKITVDEWLIQEFQKQLPDRSIEEIKEMSTEIIDSLKTTEKMKAGQQKAIAEGRSKESWLASTLQKSTSMMSAKEGANYLQTLDDAVKNANDIMHKTITTKSSSYSIPNQNPKMLHLRNCFPL